MKTPHRDRRTAGVLIAAVLVAVAVIGILFASSSNAEPPPPNEGVCEGTHIDGGDQTSITITAPEGQLISSICVKAGSIVQGDGPEIITYDPPVASVTFEHSSGKEVSHYTVTYVPVTTTSTTAPPSTTTSTTVPPTTTSTTEQPTTTTSTTVPPTTSTTIVGPTQFAFGAAGTECQAEVPVIVITFANTFPELAGETGAMIVTALADDSIIGEVEVVYAPGETVEFLYPGAETDSDGNIIDLPGWNLNEDGLWVIDESDAFLREGLLLTYTVGEEVATAEVTYPPESSTCANPPENPPPTTAPPAAPPIPATPPADTPTGDLPRTGADVFPFALAGALLIGVGGIVMFARRGLI